MAMHIVALFRRQPKYRARDIVRITDPTVGNERQQLLRFDVIFPCVSVDVGLYRSRRDCLDADFLGAKFLGQGLHQHEGAPLRGAIVAVSRPRDAIVDRAREDDVADVTACVASLADAEAACRLAGAEELSPEVG